MPAVGFPSRASKKQLTSYSSILPYQKGSRIAFVDFSATLAHYSTRILLVSSKSYGILQATSRSSGRAIPAYFLAKMHPKPHVNNYFHFLVNPEHEFSTLMSVIAFPSRAFKKQLTSYSSILPGQHAS